MSITVVVLTRNEAAFIGSCLASAQYVSNDLVVLDSGSTDDTVEIARSLGASVERHEWLGYPAMRNLALDRCNATDWVLFLDADERIPPALAIEIRDTIDNVSPSVDGLLIPRRNVICGRVMRSYGWWPDYQLRLMRPDRCHYAPDGAVHEVARCQGTTAALNNPLIHLNYRTWGEFATKQFAYARLSAARPSAPRLRSYVGAPAREFWRRFGAEKGFLDGLHGLLAALILSASETIRVWHARHRRP